jgi:hypothetical protein
MVPLIKVIAPAGQLRTHVEQPTQRLASYPFSGSFCCDSGVEHHLQERGQPFKNRTVLSPGPSWIEVLSIRRTTPTVSGTTIGLSYRNTVLHRSADYLILNIFAELYKIGCITCYSNQQSTIVVRVLLSQN